MQLKAGLKKLSQIQSLRAINVYFSLTQNCSNATFCTCIITLRPKGGGMLNPKLQIPGEAFRGFAST